MAQFQNTLISFILVGLIVFGIMAFTVNIQSENNSEVRLLNDSFMNNTYSNLENDLNDFKDTADSQKELFESENPVLSFGTLIFYSIVSAGKVFSSMMIGMFNVVISLPVTYFGISPIIVGVLGIILIISIIIGLWIIYKVGG